MYLQYHYNEYFYFDLDQATEGGFSIFVKMYPKSRKYFSHSRRYRMYLNGMLLLNFRNISRRNLSIKMKSPIAIVTGLT